MSSTIKENGFLRGVFRGGGGGGGGGDGRGLVGWGRHVELGDWSVIFEREIRMV